MSIKVRVSKAEIDTERLNKSIMGSRFFRDLAYSNAEGVVEKNKEELLNEFNSHPVTVEIEEGPDAENRSGLLGGYGNLYSFIGFEEGSRPIEAVEQAIKKIRVKKTSFKARKYLSFIDVSYDLDLRSVQILPLKTQMPWESGRSWLTAIERGISGFSYYLAGKFAKSRSGGGVQVNKKTREGLFLRTSYFTRMYSRFLNKLNRGIK
jgi:hypothetical protein